MKRLLVCLILIAFQQTAWSQCLNSDVSMEELSDDLPGQTFSAVMQVNAQPDRIMQVLLDMESYPDYMDDVSEVTIVSRQGNILVIEEKLDLPLGKVKRYRLQISVSDTRLEWQQLPWTELPEDERIADTRGWWSVSGIDAGCSSVEYRVYTDPGKVPFGFGWIVERLTESSIPGLMQAVRERVESRVF